MERPLLPENLLQVTFDDAAIYFSEEQWQNLEEFQKKIYKELIKEIYETMLALGYRIPKPEIVSRIERGEEPCIDSNKKQKLEEPQAEGSKDTGPVIKVERQSPEASIHIPPSEISSSQERSGAQCPRCGTCCNNQCGMGYQWNTQGMYPGPPQVDNNHRKQFVAPSPTYFNGSPISPGYANRGEAMPHPTSPMGYNNMGMVPLSPHYPVYRNVGDPNTTFPFPERPQQNPMFGNFEVNQQTQMGPPGSHMTASEHENRNRKEQYINAREGQFQERRNQMGPCPACGTFCNNQCAASFQWEQRRLQHGVPGAMETNRYASPPNPYFNAGANQAAFSNVRHPLRHGTPPMNVQGNPAMIQLSPQFAGYRRQGDPRSPNVMHGKQEHPQGHVIHGGNTAAANLHGPNQTGKYGTMPANMGGNHRKSQSMSPLAALETMPMMSTNNSPNAVNEQRSRSANQVANATNAMMTEQRSRPPNQMVNNSPNALTDQRSRPQNQMANNSPNAFIDQRSRHPNQMANNSPNAINEQRNRLANQMAISCSNTLTDQRSRPIYQMANNSPNTITDQRSRPPTYQMVTTSPNTITDHRTRPPTYQMATSSPNTITDHRTRFTYQMVNTSSNNVTDQRNRPPAQIVTSSDATRGTVAQNINKRPDNFQCSIIGGKLVQSVTPPTGNTGQPRPGEMTFNRSPSLGHNGNYAHKNAQPSSTMSQEVGRTTTGESVGSKRPASQQASDGVLPPKRASPTVIIVDCDEGKPASSQVTSANNPDTARRTPTSKSESLPSEPIVVSDDQDTKNAELQDSREDKRSQASITISSIRTSGIFNPPTIRGKREVKNDSNTIIIIDDKDPEGAVHQTLQTKTSKDESQTSTCGTPPMKNPKAAGEPPPLAPKVQQQGVQQGTPVMVNKVHMQQPSPIIVTGGTSLGNQQLPVNGNQSIMLTFPVTVGNSGIMLATPVNISENQISGANHTNRMPVGKNPRFVQPNSVPINIAPQNVHSKLGQVTMRPVIGQANRLAVPHGQAKSITVNVSQPGSVAGTLSINNANLQKVNGGTFKAAPVTSAGNQPVGQSFPLFVDANSGLILTGSAVPSKDSVPSGIGNATMVTVNGGVVSGNVGQVAMGGKLAFSPVNVNGLANTTFITVDGPMSLGNNSSVTLASNPTNINNKGALNIGNSTILTLNGGMGSIGSAHPVGAPIANIASINTNGTLQVATTAASAVVSGQQNSGIIIRKVGDPSTVSQNPQPSEDSTVVVVERLFNCSECGEKFNSLENLTSHQVVHKRPNAQPEGKAGEATSKDNEVLPGGAEDDSHTILYTTQGDDGSTVYVVTV
ncbi:uncharacterized protein LOC120941724 [Rana temporaria]|uniref:uncharacterized protein LOC120941724 n=1 Tax=Rana temporaria TaxID=8407 RepID=UPI001AADF584|nr:uncharacterized protein LOC120941724 [Rana temporaria]